MGSLELDSGGAGATIRVGGGLGPVPGRFVLVLALLVAVGVLAIGQGDADRSAASSADGPSLDAAYGDLPLSFAPNQGQAGARGRFVAQGPGYSITLGRTGAVLGLDRARGSESAPALAMSFVGARPAPPIAGADKLPGTVNSYIGDDPSRWRSGIPTFEEVRYSEPWPGISVAFHGNQSELEYDFLLAPGADPSRIQLDYDGARAIHLSEAGDLVASMPGGGHVTQAAPVSYQRADGVREPVESEFRLLGGDRVGLALGRYDRDRPLVVDPTLSYSTYLGGADFDQALGIAVDSDGNAYVTGTTASTNFPTTAGVFQTALAGSLDVFVSKLNAAGTSLVYSTYLGGANVDIGSGIAVDGNGSAQVTGNTSSTDFPTTPGAFQIANAGSNDAFVTKLNAAGTALSYSTYLGGPTVDQGAGISLDSAGNAFVVGATDSGAFPTTVGAFQTVLGGSFDAFATRLNATGSALIYSTYLGGSGGDTARGLAVDAAGATYVAGETSSLNFPTANAIQAVAGGNGDAFATKLNPAGSAAVYSTYLGGSAVDSGRAIALDSAGSAHVVGDTASPNFPTANALQGVFGGGIADAYATKLNPPGSAFVYSTYLGGSGLDAGFGAAVDGAGSLNLAGTTASTNFPTSNPVQAANAGGRDSFASQLNSSGASLAFSTYLGGSGNDAANGIALRDPGEILFAGDTASTDFPTANAVQGGYGGGIFDAFIAKLSRRPTSTALACLPDSLAVGASATCTATVTDTGSGSKSSPTGTVTFGSDSQGGFAPAASCALADSGGGTSTCSVDYVPQAAGTHAITATYPGNASHGESASSPAQLSVSSGSTPDDDPPDVILSGREKQPLDSSVAVKVQSNEDASVVVTGTLGVRAANQVGKDARVRQFDLKQRTRMLSADAKSKFELKFTQEGKQAAKNALRRGGRAKARLRVEVTDAAGNETVAKRVVKLKP